MTGSRKKQQKRDDPMSASTYKIIVVGGGGVGKEKIDNIYFFQSRIFSFLILRFRPLHAFRTTIGI